MGLRRLSISPRRIPEIKTWIRELSGAELAELAHQCMQFSTAAEVQGHLESFVECVVSERLQAAKSSVF
jgi:phosphoenolpyruvate-protein kinase (PTS system EI component)